MIRFASGEVALLRRDRILVACTPSLMLIGSMLLWAAPPTSIPGWGPVSGFAMFVGGAFGLLYILLKEPNEVHPLGVVTAGDGGLTFDGRCVATRSSILAGFITTVEDAPAIVRLERGPLRSVISLEVQSEALGRDLLRALELDVTQRSIRFRCSSHLAWNVASAGLVLGVASVLGLLERGYIDGASAILLVIVSPALVLSLFRLLAMRGVIGADGLLIRSLWQKRFIAYRDIEQLGLCDASPRRVTLDLVSGPRIHLLIDSAITTEAARDEVDRITQRLGQAIADHKQRYAARDVELPERGERTAAEWVRQLRAVGTGAAADHRTAPIGADELWRIVEDPGATTQARAQATVAVGAALEACGRARLRMIAQATAAPELRGLIELAAEDAGEERLATALERV